MGFRWQWQLKGMGGMLALCLSLPASGALLRESAIVPFKRQMAGMEDDAARKWAALQLQNIFNPHAWLAIADFAFHQKDGPLATQLGMGLPADAPLHMSYLMRGMGEVARGNLEAAHMNFDSATRASDRLIVARGYYYQGELIYQGLKNPQKAPRELERMHYFFQKALEFNPDHGPSHFGIARRYIYEGKWAMAIKQLEITLKVDPEDGLARYNLGIILAQQKSWKAAYDHLYHAYMLRPFQSDVAKELVRAAYYAGHESMAQSVLREMLKRSPLPPEEMLPLVSLVLFRKIERDYRSGQIQKALNQYLTLAKHFPEMPEIQIRIGMCYRELGPETYVKAQQYFQAYIQKRPQAPEGYFEMGVLTYRQNHKVRAAQEFLQALALSPQDSGNLWLWTYKTLYELKLYDSALYVLGKADEHPYLDIEYRDVVSAQKQKIEKELKTTPTVIQGITFSSIERLLQQMAAGQLGSTSAKHVARP